MFKNKKVIIFDMDGTLIDSVGIWNEIDSSLIIQLGGEKLPEEEIQLQRDTLLREYSRCPNPYEEYCGTLGKKYKSSLTAAEIVKLRYNIAQKYLVESIDYKADAENLLKLLKASGYTLVIATTTRRGNMDIYQRKNKNILNKAPLDQYFSLIYTREDVKEIKPNPEIYYRIMKELDISPKECLIFEDSLIGVEAGNNAGIEVAAVYDRYSAGELNEIKEKADYYFESFAQVIDIFSK